MEDINEKRSGKKNQTVADLKRELKKGVVTFWYTKKDGSKRKAKGTLKDSMIPKEDKDDDRRDNLSKDCLYYYDLDKDDWRCMLKVNFIKYKENKSDK